MRTIQLLCVQHVQLYQARLNYFPRRLNQVLLPPRGKESPHWAISLPNVELFNFVIFAKLVGVHFHLVMALI